MTSKHLSLAMTFWLALTFGLILPQNAEAADAAGMERLNSYTPKINQGMKLDDREVDEIAKIINQDGKVDKDEYNYLDNILTIDDNKNTRILSEEALKIIQSLHFEYVRYYSVETQEKYPELSNLGDKLPLNLRRKVNDSIFTNIVIAEHLSGDEKLDDEFKKIANHELAYAKKILKDIQDALPTSPYREILTRIYNTETKSLEENLKRLSER